ncbi:MAG: cytochrome b [Solirubrobacterales bacterium]
MQFRYSPARRLVHWTSALLVAVAFATIWGREAFDDPTDRLFWLQWHRLAGLTTLVVTALRLAMRLTDGRAPSPGGTTRLETLAAAFVHDGLVAALIVQPMLGWAYTSAKGRALDLFGLLQLPALMGKDPAWADRLGAAHQILGYLILAGAALHVAAALYHAVWRRDGVLTRMTFSRTV